MIEAKALVEKWNPILESDTVAKIHDSHRKHTTAVVLENTEKYLKEADVTNVTGGVKNFDPVMISLVRQAMPQLMAFDVCGVQPMTGPTGLIFAMRHHYKNQTGPQAQFNEVDTGFSAQGVSGTATQTGTNPGILNDSPAGTYDYVTGMATATGEQLGRQDSFNEMAFSIDKVSVTAKTRKLAAEYSLELQQDLKNIHGLDAENELANILSTEIIAEINREVIRTIYNNSVMGAQNNVTTPGTFDLVTDSDGRWAVEKFKTLLYQIERDANAINHRTRRGKGNILITSADVASALVMAGVLDYAPALQAQSGLNVDETSGTFAGVLMGRYKVYIDPYSANVSDSQYYVVGYKGTNPYDAGMFYAPYVPLSLMRAVNTADFTPRIGFQTRYGMVANPFVSADGSINNNTNEYYRRVKIANILG